ncbi:MAG: flagellar hook protein FlgE [Rhodospirillales bacterium]
MPLYGALSIATLGMKGQSYAMNVIGNNIANMTTGGFKRSDVNFKTLASRAYFNQQDNGSARPTTHQRVRDQGILKSTQRSLDLAVNGRGMFIVSRGLDGQDHRYTRDGSFEVEAQGTLGYLTDKNGHYLLGYPTGGGDLDSTNGAPMPMQVDSNAFSDNFAPTTMAEMGLNLPADAPILGATDTMTAAERHRSVINTYDSDGTKTEGLEVYNFQIVDDEGDTQDVRANFTKTADNSWLVSVSATKAVEIDRFTFTHAKGVADAGETYRVNVNGNTVSYTATGVETMQDVRDELIELVNAADGYPVRAEATAQNNPNGLRLVSATPGRGFTSRVTVVSGTPSAPDTDVTVRREDLSAITTAPTAMPFNTLGRLESEDPIRFGVRFTDENDNISQSNFTLDFTGTSQYDGEFTKFRYERDGLAKATLTGVAFDNNGYVVGRFGDGTHRKIYRIPLANFINPDGLSPRNGNAYQESLESGEAETGFFNGRMLANTVEGSNVDVSEEFTKMIITQNAYNSNATVFRTADEMTQTARDLKR